ncbi:S41 family peptidase [Agarilytica rhodophyticola]|uniref:S41 family peptidase n=1 Tax=Agarilytica rhodophyticola TaxID=1737490 RepID=UPI000B3414B2|nr:S41 family peptidase [Agarilytica rhodophyticola]
MNQIRKLLLFVTFFSLCFSSNVFAQELAKLQDVRDEIVFPELTDDEKRIMVEQAQIFLRDLYVHRFDKLDFYPGLEDPVGLVADVVDNIDSLSSAEMEEALYDIFVSQRDLHLNYIFPSPHADYRSFLPLTLTRTASRRNFFEVRVNSVNQEQFERFAPGQRVPAIGDRVVRYDNLPIRRAVNRQLATAQGANRFGGFTRALGQMTFVSHLLHLVPENDDVTITFETETGRGYWKKRERYTITLPWITQLPARAAAANFSTSRALPAAPAKRKFNPEDWNNGVDMWQEEFNNFISENGLAPISDYPSNPSNEPNLTWGIIDNQFGSFGYFNLTTFSPTNGGDFTIAEIRRIIFEEFGDTDGLIFDVRNNGGGSIILADTLSQLFSRNEVRAINARLLNTDLNRTIFNESIFGAFSNPEWTEVINAAEGTGAIYSDLAPFTRDPDANLLGQAYYKPVAVLANARSYSATDLFTCTMRDNVAALVYGEDPRTGAGGANVITHALFNQVLPSVFEPLPGDHRMRVSWRQSVRFGRSEGRIIEDFGCEADIDASQTKNDLLTGGDTQIKRITRSLAWRANSGRYDATVRPLQNATTVFLGASDTTYDVFVSNTKKINVLLNGERINQVAVYAGMQEELVSLPLPENLTVGEPAFVTFEGVDYYGQRLWNLKRNFVVLGEKLVVDEEGVEVDFAQATSAAPFVVINRNPPEDGWNLVSPNLEIGFNPEYADNLNTDAVLLMDMSGLTSAQLVFDIEYDTEPGFDFLEVFMEDGSGNTTSLLRVSGSQPMTTFDFDVSQFAGQDTVLLHYRFTSDTNTVAPGVRLGRVSIR